LKPKAPAPPDYAALAKEQGTANIEAARLAGRLNNPNIYTPYGSREVTFGGQGDYFDQDAFTKAMDQYNRDLSAFNVTNGQPLARPVPSQFMRGGGGDGGDEIDQAAYLQALNQFNAAGSRAGSAPLRPSESQFMRDYDPNKVIINERLTPEAQQLFDQDLRISRNYGDVAERGLNRVGEAMGQDFDPSLLPSVNTNFGNMFAPVERAQFSQFDRSPDIYQRERVEQALMDRLRPQLEQNRQQREDQLLLQGQGRGGRAWQSSQDDLSRAENDAMLAAILGAGDEQQRMYNMDLGAYDATLRGEQSQYSSDSDRARLNANIAQSRYGVEEAARNRALQEALTLRQLPLTEINALRTGSQPVVPQFQPYQGQGIQAAPIFDAGQAQYNAEIGAVNAKNAATGNTISGLASLGGAVLGAGGAARGFSNLFR
jgi:hypothetical protein